MTENEVSKIVVDSCFQVHNELGPGLFESVYEECLFYLPEKNGSNKNGIQRIVNNL